MLDKQGSDRNNRRTLAVEPTPKYRVEKLGFQHGRHVRWRYRTSQESVFLFAGLDFPIQGPVVVVLASLIKGSEWKWAYSACCKRLPLRSNLTDLTWAYSSLWKKRIKIIIGKDDKGSNVHAFQPAFSAVGTRWVASCLEYRKFFEIATDPREEKG